MSPLLLPPIVVSALVCFTGNGGVNETGDWRISNFPSASKAAKSCTGVVAWNAGDGGVADARGDARGSDAIEALGVGVFGGGDGIIADGDWESGMADPLIRNGVLFGTTESSN